MTKTNPYKHYYAGAHPFEKSGLGQAPFRATSFEHVAGTGNSCDHCGRHITNLNYVKSADNKVFVVGSSCIERTGDEKLTDAIRAEKKKYEQARYQERKNSGANWEKKHNGGRTLDEIADDFYDASNKKYDAAVAGLSDIPQKFAAILADGKGGFRDSVAKDMEAGRLPRGRGLYITIEILAKEISGGRKNSEAYTAEYDKLETLFEGAEETEKAADKILKAEHQIIRDAFWDARNTWENPAFDTDKVKKELALI